MADLLGARRELRTTGMWTIAALVVLGTIMMIVVTPKIGAFTLAGVLVAVGTARLVLPGTPFGLAVRSRLFDVASCYGVALAILVLANSAHSLK